MEIKVSREDIEAIKYRFAQHLMTIELKKTKDGPPSLSCVRADGTRTWARVQPFFPAHDLTHCAVESVLGFREAFFGLVASGWDLDDFAQPGAAAKFPRQSLWAEHIVGLIERNLAPDATALNAALGSIPGAVDVPRLTSDQLDHILSLRNRLLEQWQRLAPGGTMSVDFPARQ